MDYTLRIDRPSEQVIPELMEALRQRQLQVAISFDLQQARAIQAACDCPHHGQAPCTCQYAVLLVYDLRGGRATSGTITVHGRDGRVWLSLIKNPPMADDNDAAHQLLEQELLSVLLSFAVASHIEAEATNDLTGIEAQATGEANYHDKEVMHMVKDPVCGMEIDPAQAAGSAVYEGKTYYFCAPGCQKAFEKEPKKYLGQSAPGHEGHGHA